MTTKQTAKRKDVMRVTEEERDFLNIVRQIGVGSLIEQAPDLARSSLPPAFRSFADLLDAQSLEIKDKFLVQLKSLLSEEELDYLDTYIMSGIGHILIVGEESPLTVNLYNVLCSEVLNCNKALLYLESNRKVRRWRDLEDDGAVIFNYDDMSIQDWGELIYRTRLDYFSLKIWQDGASRMALDTLLMTKAKGIMLLNNVHDFDTLKRISGNTLPSLIVEDDLRNTMLVLKCSKDEKTIEMIKPTKKAVHA